MAEEDKDKEGQTGGQTGSENTTDADAFWKEHEKRTLGVLDSWFDKKKEELRTVGTSRTGKPGGNPVERFLAGIMFGPTHKP